MGKSLTEVKAEFSKQLADVSGRIDQITKESESLKIKQMQLVGAVYAMDVAMQESEAKDEEPAVDPQPKEKKGK
jgi:hypothetical protein